MAFGGALQEEIDYYKRKIEKSALPPDPLRIVEAVLRGPPAIEHVLPVPPILERVHAEVVKPAIEKAPRLPLTGDFVEPKFLEWIEER